MKRLFFILWLVLLSMIVCGCTAASAVGSLAASVVGKIWIHIDGKWQSPPVDADHATDYRMAPVTLIRMAGDHEFSMMHCWIIEYHEKLTVSAGDGQVIFIGTWQEADSEMVAKFRRMYETVQPVGGGEYPGPEEQASAVVIGRAVKFRGQRFEEAKALDAVNYEAFIRLERTIVRK